MNRDTQHTSEVHCANAETFLGALKRLYEHYERPDVIASEKSRAEANADKTSSFVCTLCRHQCKDARDLLLHLTFIHYIRQITENIPGDATKCPFAGCNRTEEGDRFRLTMHIGVDHEACMTLLRQRMRTATGMRYQCPLRECKLGNFVGRDELYLHMNAHFHTHIVDRELTPLQDALGIDRAACPAESCRDLRYDVYSEPLLVKHYACHHGATVDIINSLDHESFNADAFDPTFWNECKRVLREPRNRTYVCQKCHATGKNNAFCNERSLLHHLSMVHFKDEGLLQPELLYEVLDSAGVTSPTLLRGARMATCLTCNATVKHSLIARHMGVAHKTALSRPSGAPNWDADIRPTELHCPKCSAFFCGGENKKGELSDLLKRHLLEQHFKEQFEKELGRHAPKCPMCPEQIPSLAALKLHVFDKHRAYTLNFLKAYCPSFDEEKSARSGAAKASSSSQQRSVVTITLDEAGETVEGNDSPAVNSESGTEQTTSAVSGEVQTTQDGQAQESTTGVEPTPQETGDGDGRRSAASDASGESVVVVASPPPPAAAAAAAPASSGVEVIDVDDDEEDADDPRPAEQDPRDSSKESEKLFATFKTECAQHEKSYKKVTRSFLKEFLGRHRSLLSREIIDKFLFLVGHVQEGSRADWLKGSEMELFIQELLKRPPATTATGDASHEPAAGAASSPQNRPTQTTPVPNYNVSQNMARQAASTLVRERGESRSKLPLKLEDICKSIGRFSFTEPKASAPTLFNTPEDVIKSVVRNNVSAPSVTCTYCDERIRPTRAGSGLNMSYVEFHSALTQHCYTKSHLYNRSKFGRGDRGGAARPPTTASNSSCDFCPVCGTLVGTGQLVAHSKSNSHKENLAVIQGGITCR